MYIRVINKVYYELNEKFTEKLLDQYIRPNYPDCDFTVKKSRNSNSIYIKIKRYDSEITLRLSDHNNPNSKLKHHFVTPDTKITVVIGIIVNTVNRLTTRSLYNALDNL